MASTQSMKTPLRANVSAKLSSDKHTVQLIMREILSSTNIKSHIICGSRGIGKTWTAHIVAQLPLCKTNFSHGILWLGLGSDRPLCFSSLCAIYQKLCAQLNLSIETVCSDMYAPSNTNSNKKNGESHQDDDEEKEKYREARAMLQVRDTITKLISHRNILLCIDGLYDSDDVQYFEFHDKYNPKLSHFRLLVTTNEMPEIMHHTRVWQLTNYYLDAAKAFFLSSLKQSTTQSPDFLQKYSEIFRTCQGNPLSMKTLAQLVDDKIVCKNYKSLDSFVSKFENVPSEPKIQIFNILEALFTNSSLGSAYNKIIWRCFAAFASVFKRDGCIRPCISRSPTKALFSAVISRLGGASQIKDGVEQGVTKVIEFLVKINVLIQIDGFDHGSTPRTFYQIDCDIYQAFGEQLSSSPETNMRLHSLFINEYTTMFSSNHESFGSNEIDHFMLKWLPHHLRKSGDIEDQAMTLPDYRFIQERISFLGISDAVKKQIHDAESFVRMSINGSKILLPSYEAFTRVLETQMMSKENDDKFDESHLNAGIDAMWSLAISLFAHFYVREGCQLVLKAIDFDDEDKSRISIDKNLFESLSDPTTKADHLNTARSLIRIGAVIAKSNRRQYSTNIILLGLKGLAHCLGNSNLEVARAHVYIGEVFYRDLKFYDDAMAQFRLSLPLLLKELGEGSEEVFDAIILCGKTYVHLGYFDTALEILEKVAPQLKGRSEIEVRYKVASIYMTKGDPKHAHSILVELKQRTLDRSLMKKINSMLEDCSDFQRYTI